jgi:Domain of unknown function (DUF4410)
MTTQLVQEIRKLGLPVESAEMAGPVTEGQLSIEGQFLTIDEGNRTRRLVIGFGAGASHVRIAVQMLETIAGQHRLVEDFYTTPVVRGSLDSDPWQVWALRLVRLLQ